ncbi:MAG: hypothetical protein A2075_13630 [Geobacteraceae bacterium GWC2_58_44]|nr:MAG: hypothetical protein A2075_13630 [Geobacteraceae bacterium GWC2_58_44]HBG04243.1 hypothetical protein [Geobacter sp.]
MTIDYIFLIAHHLVPKFQLGNANCVRSSASTPQSWSFDSDCIPKLELGNEKKLELGNEKKLELGNEKIVNYPLSIVNWI